ncbi:hypothetical protein [Corynebacterium jeikeium]|uniref:hypothetical protein n=1 Tax=Corynebacterium jeikeium TaxID=38289 RepID=UPI000B233860|nr:hypothetical protein [Corynebacterium jeikeium]
MQESYVEVRFSGGTRVSVPAITRAFQEELFTILVGTAALLGEGWDSPCANALIIASSVRAFMLTNQMRGRVIRVDLALPDKTANIWHIATCEPGQVAGRGAWLDQMVQSGAQALNIGANVRLSGGTFAERKLFADAMTQLSGEIRNARYLIAPAHQVRIRGIFCAQSVPDVLGTRRENVDEFLHQLQRVDLPMRAVYTRSQEGRDFLLQARKLSGANIAARLASQTRRYEKQSPLDFPIV